MFSVTPLAITPRTATFLCAPPGARFRLPKRQAWHLEDAKGQRIRDGLAETVVLFIEGLQPGSRYCLHVAGKSVVFETGPCAGLINASDMGADPDAANNADALQAAISAVPPGGTLTLSPGTYATGPIFLKPQMTLYLPSGVTIAAIGDRTGWPILPSHDLKGRVIGTWEGLPEPAFAAVITAIDCHGLAITGSGVIDGGGDRGDWWLWPKETRQGARRPRTLHLAHGDDISVTGLTIRNSPSWTFHPCFCKRLTAAALTIANPENSPNTDGLNPESCRDVEITGVAFTVGDDCIAIKAGKRGAAGEADHLAPTQSIRIRHCYMEKGHGAVVLGSEMSGGIRDVSVEACEMLGTDRGLRIKTRRGRGGEVLGVTFRDVVMDEVPTPLAINAFYFCDIDGKSPAVQSREPAPVDVTTPRISGITFQRVTARNVSIAAAAILGLPEAPVTDVTLQDYRVSYDPAASFAVPLMACDVPAVRHAGVLAEFSDVTGEPETIQYTKDPEPC